MANPDIARLESIAREGRVQILRMLAYAGSGHPGGSLSVIDLLTVLYFNRLRDDAADDFLVFTQRESPEYQFTAATCR